MQTGVGHLCGHGHLEGFLRSAILPPVSVASGSGTQHGPSSPTSSTCQAGHNASAVELGCDLRFHDARLEELWQLHRGVSLQGLDCSALALCGVLQLLSLRRQWRYAGPVLQLLLIASAAASLAACWCCRMQPFAFRRQRRACLAACKLGLLLTTAAVAATQSSRLPRKACRYWHIVVFALLYGRGLFLGMSSVFLQSGFAYEALVTAVSLPVFLAEVPIMCNDTAVAAELPRTLFANLAKLLTGVADSFPLPLPPTGWRMGGFAACMAVHAFLQVATGVGGLMLAYFLELRARMHFAARRGRPIGAGAAAQLDLALQLGLGFIVLLSATWKACQAVGLAASSWR